MVQIKSLDISRLRNDEDFGYQTRVVNLAVAMLSQDVDKPVVDAYKAALTAFDAALKQAAKTVRPKPWQQPMRWLTVCTRD